MTFFIYLKQRVIIILQKINEAGWRQDSVVDAANAAASYRLSFF